MTGQTPSDGKVSLTRMEFWMFGNKVLGKILPSLGSDRSFIKRSLKRLLVQITSPRFVEANGSGVNFLNGY